MLSRGWIRPNIYSKWLQRDEWCNDEIPQMLSEILTEIRKSFQCKDIDELKEKLDWTGDLMDKEANN